MKTEKRATETWGFQILPTLYSTYQKVAFTSNTHKKTIAANLFFLFAKIHF